MGKIDLQNAAKFVGIPFMLTAMVFGVFLSKRGTNLVSRAGISGRSTKYFHFEMADNPNEVFIVRVDDPKTSERITKSISEDTMLVIVGKVKKGDGGFNTKKGGYWNWHLDPQTISVSEKSVEMCDVRPNYLEKNLGDWIGKTFCPSGTRLTSVYDTPSLPP